jgi:hypothetical protein
MIVIKINFGILEENLLGTYDGLTCMCISIDICGHLLLYIAWYESTTD